MIAMPAQRPRRQMEEKVKARGSGATRTCLAGAAQPRLHPRPSVFPHASASGLRATAPLRFCDRRLILATPPGRIAAIVPVSAAACSAYGWHAWDATDPC